MTVLPWGNWRSPLSFQLAYAAYVLDWISEEEASDVGVQALVEGLDSQAIREMAGWTPQSDWSRPEVIVQAFVEIVGETLDRRKAIECQVAYQLERIANGTRKDLVEAAKVAMDFHPWYWLPKDEGFEESSSIVQQLKKMQEYYWQIDEARSWGGRDADARDRQRAGSLMRRCRREFREWARRELGEQVEG
ncbi:MAG: hypothetical protein KDB68_12405 [Planctomycetes bacterium]|nr:hypothetical protein [Planctomycetota bacterium]MCA8936993.1 hypothetical protein [Planctomycetota bacterium]